MTRYERMCRLDDLQAAIKQLEMQLEFDLSFSYVPRDVPPTAENLTRPVFLQIQAD